MSLQDITITGSIGSIATQSYGQRTYIPSTDEQSFPIEEIAGTQAGSFPNFVPGTNYTVDLIVNVTQSWSENIITPLGIVNTTHNTMEEFIDGEFSGSNYVVTDGSLNDIQCEQFLTVNTTPTSYSIFPYSVYRSDDAIVGTSQFGTFINDLTAPPDGGILMFYESDDYTDVPPTVNYKRITYLKISRFDKEGNDNTLSLQELTSIRWTDSTAGLIDLKVLTITEYPTYYLYTIVSKIWVDLIYYADDNILNYSLSASFIGPSSSAGLMYLDNWNVINNSGGTFNTYYYTFDITPNIDIKYTASITAYNGNISPVTFNFGLWENTYVGNEVYYTPIAQTQSVTLNFGDTKTFTLKGLTNSSFIGNSSVQYHLETSNLNLPISLSNTFWIVTHSVTPQTSTSSVVLEPYLLSNFANSDCDVLMNNYSENDYSTFYQEVLYDNGGTIPSNLQQIIDGTAQPAPINDYLYNASANRLPRYEGVRTTSANFNLPSTNGFSNEELANFDPIAYPNNLIINNGVPNVENTTTYFGYFTSLKSNNPIFKGTTSPILKYLIREDGEVFNPASDEATYYNIVDSFPKGTKAYTNLLFNKTTIFNSTQSILLSGESYSPILYTISASNGSVASYTSQIEFTNIVGTPLISTDYSFYRHFINPPSIGLAGVGTPTNLAFNGINTAFSGYDTSSGYTTGIPGVNIYDPHYTFNNVPQTYIKPIINIQTYNVSGPGAGLSGAVYFRIDVYTYNLSTFITTLRGTKTDSAIGPGYSYSTSGGNVFSYIVPTFIPDPGDVLYATVTVTSFTPSTSGITFGNPSIKIEPQGLSINSAGPTFWTTGSANSTSITSSADLGAAIQGNYRQVDIPNSGFDPIELPCQPKIGDEIRFEYDEINSRRIIDIISSASGSSGNPITILILDKAVPTTPAININHFTIRRKVKDYITGITLDSNLISQIDEGFLMPEYPSSDLKNNLSKIINDLSQKNVI